MVVAVARAQAARVMRELRKTSGTVWELGQVVPLQGRKKSFVRVFESETGESALLDY